MAFITMMFVFFALLLGAFCFMLLIASVILAIIFSKKEYKSAKIIKTVSCIFICISIVGLLPGMFILGFGIAKSATVPESFVDMEITAEPTEDGFVTSDGRIFKELPYMHNDIEGKEACFAVKPEGFFKRSEWGNIYSFETDGKTLYIYTSDYYPEGIIYCEAERYGEVLSYFAENRRWVQNFTHTPCSAEAVAIIEKYKAMGGATELKFPDTYMYLEEKMLKCLSNDDAIRTDECTFVKCNGSYYIYTYYIIEDYYKYYGFELTEEEAKTAENEFFAFS